MKARILIQHAPSKGNKDLLKFLMTNIDVIKKYVDIKVVIVYDKLIPKLEGKTKKLPIMVSPSFPTATGNNEIKKMLKQIVEGPAKHVAVARTGGGAPKERSPEMDVKSYMDEIMYAKDDEETDDMDAVKQKTMERTMNRNKMISEKAKPKPKNTTVVDTPRDNIKLDSIGKEKVSDFTNDPMMKMFFDNMEESPT